MWFINKCSTWYVWTKNGHCLGMFLATWWFKLIKKREITRNSIYLIKIPLKCQYKIWSMCEILKFPSTLLSARKVCASFFSIRQPKTPKTPTKPITRKKHTYTHSYTPNIRKEAVLCAQNQISCLAHTLVTPCANIYTHIAPPLTQPFALRIVGSRRAKHFCARSCAVFDNKLCRKNNISGLFAFHRWWTGWFGGGSSRVVRVAQTHTIRKMEMMQDSRSVYDDFSWLWRSARK